MVIKQLAKQLTFVFIFYSIPLPHVFSPQNPFLSNKSVGEVCVSYDLFKSRVENGLLLDRLLGVRP